VDVSGLYWRKSALNAGKCPPGLLALRNGRLSFTTATSVEFDEHVTSITGSLTGWGSLVISAAGRRYVMLTTVGQVSPPFTKTQQQAITAATRAASLRTIADWPAILNAAGATISTPKYNYRPWLLGALLVVLAAGAITALVLNGGF
jgi:hypothetical protein